MREQGTPYTSIALEERPELAQAFKEAGHKQAPIITVEREGQVIAEWSGFNPERIKSLTNLTQFSNLSR